MIFNGTQDRKTKLKMTPVLLLFKVQQLQYSTSHRLEITLWSQQTKLHCVEFLLVQLSLNPHPQNK